MEEEEMRRWRWRGKVVENLGMVLGRGEKDGEGDGVKRQVAMDIGGVDWWLLVMGCVRDWSVASPYGVFKVMCFGLSLFCWSV